VGRCDVTRALISPPSRRAAVSYALGVSSVAGAVRYAPCAPGGKGAMPYVGHRRRERCTSFRSRIGSGTVQSVLSRVFAQQGLLRARAWLLSGPVWPACLQPRTSMRVGDQRPRTASLSLASGD